MRQFNSPTLLATLIKREVEHTHDSISILLSNVRLSLGGTLKYGLGPCGTETGSITKFAQDFGFEYLNMSIKGGEEVCNFKLARR
jgi:hypothetical protein